MQTDRMCYPINAPCSGLIQMSGSVNSCDSLSTFSLCLRLHNYNSGLRALYNVTVVTPYIANLVQLVCQYCAALFPSCSSEKTVQLFRFFSVAFSVQNAAGFFTFFRPFPLLIQWSRQYPSDIGTHTHTAVCGQ